MTRRVLLGDRRLMSWRLAGEMAERWVGRRRGGRGEGGRGGVESGGVRDEERRGGEGERGRGREGCKVWATEREVMVEQSRPPHRYCRGREREE